MLDCATDDEIKGLLPALNALIDMQRHMLKTWEGVTTRFDRLDAENVKLVRQNLKMQEDLAALRADFSGFRHDITVRVDALAARMAEFENTLDENTRATKAAHSEIVTLQNQILNA